MAPSNYFIKFSDIIQRLMIPTLKYSQTIFEEVLKSYVNINTFWLDLGCGHQILPTWREAEEKFLSQNCKLLIGLDLDLFSLKEHKSIALKIRGDISILPFDDNSFDLITANMVVEHLKCPEIQFIEINRALKPGGIFLFHTGNTLSYLSVIARIIPRKLKRNLVYILEGRKEEDVFNTHYKVNSKRKIAKIAQKTGFDIKKIKMIVSTPELRLFPPLVVFELIWIGILMMKHFELFRTNIIAILKKRGSS